GPSNNAPTATNLNAAETFTEDTSLNVIDSILSLYVTGVQTCAFRPSNPAAGSLSTATSGAVTSTFNAGTGVWTASGSIANVNVRSEERRVGKECRFRWKSKNEKKNSDGEAAPYNGSKAITGTVVNDA